LNESIQDKGKVAMQTVEEFMHELLQARIAEEKRILENRVGYRQRFYTADCSFDSHEHTLEMIESEHIISTENADSRVLVITEYNISFSQPSTQIIRRRYHLEPSGDRWLIRDVESQCLYCHGQDVKSCRYCKGSGWWRRKSGEVPGPATESCLNKSAN
jgi:hypothetical protein